MTERMPAEKLQKFVNQLRKPASEPLGLRAHLQTPRGALPVFCVFYPKAEDIPRDADGQAPAGAMFFVSFSSGHCSVHEPPCSQHLHCVTPDKHWWDIDSRANNCTMPTDKKHRCWVRHGEPPQITVDKNGLTCAAGAGSIQTGSWHGFLRNGQLVT